MELFNASAALARDAWADLTGLFLAVRLWWLTEESGPGFLLAVRIMSAVAFVAAGVSWRCLAQAPIFERTWSRGEVVRFKWLVWMISAGAFAVAAYFVTAGIMEAERTSSPHRLIVGNAAFALLSVPLAFLGYFLRLMFARKAVDIAKRAVETGLRIRGA